MVRVYEDFFMICAPVYHLFHIFSGTWADLCLRVVLPHGGGGLWPVGGWVSLVWGNLAQSAYPPPPWGG